MSNGLYSIGFLFLYLVIDKMTGMIPNAHALGTLNLVANFFENSAHGTTVGGAFRTSFWVSSRSVSKSSKSLDIIKRSVRLSFLSIPV